MARTTVTAHRGCGRRICAGPPRGDARFQTMREFAAAIAEGDGGDVAAAMAAHNPSPRYLDRSQPLSSPLAITILAAFGANLLRRCSECHLVS